MIDPAGEEDAAKKNNQHPTAAIVKVAVGRDSGNERGGGTCDEGIAYVHPALQQGPLSVSGMNKSESGCTWHSRGGYADRTKHPRIRPPIP